MEVESDGIRKSNLFEDNPFEVQSLYPSKLTDVTRKPRPCGQKIPEQKSENPGQRKS